MADTAKRVFGPALITTSVGTKYTVPAATTFIMRHLHVFNNSGTAATFTMSIGTDASGTRLYDAFSIPSKEALDWSGFEVLDTTEIIQMVAGTTNVLVATVSGVLVT